MDHKKKFLGDLKLLFPLLFIMLLGMSSTCYASTQLPRDKVEYLVDNIFFSPNGYTNLKYASSYYSNSSNTNFVIDVNYKEEVIDFWYNAINNNNDIDFSYNFDNFFAYLAYWSEGSSESERVFKGALYFTNANLGVGNTAFPYIKFYNNSFLNKTACKYPFTIFFIDDNKNFVTQSLRVIDFTYTVSSHSFSLRSFRTTNSGTTEPQNYFITRTVSNWNIDNTNTSRLNVIPGVITFYSTGQLYSNYDGTTFLNSPTPRLLQSLYVPLEEEDGESGDVGLGTITNNSGDTTGSINLEPIQNSLNNIQNQISGDSQKIIDNQNNNTQLIANTISGEVNKITNTITQPADFNNRTITSGDIENSLNFQFMADPYDNFWYEMTQGLKTSLTGSVRQLPVNWLGYPGYFDLDGLINYPQPIKNILTTVSTVCMVWLLTKWWKIIIDKLTSGDMDEVLAMNEEERHCRFILGGVYMLEAIFNFIIDLFLWLIGIIGSIIIYPVQLLLVTLIPGLGDFISVTLGFFNNYIWNYLSFIKELFLDVSCLPRSLWSIFITFVFARWLIAPTVRSIKLIINIWKLKSGGATK